MIMVSLVLAATLSVADFGAKGDGLTKDTAAIQSAIDAAAKEGGGEVVFPSGTYLSGSIYLKDDITLNLEKGALLLASPDKKDYNLPDICPQNGTSKNESSSGAHLVLAIEKRNVAIVGEGTIDGNCAAFLDGPHIVYPQSRIPWRPSQLLYFVQCDGVRIKDFTMRNAPYWSTFLHGCRDVEVRNYTIRQRRFPHTHNGDGLDIDACEHVVIEDCDINASDDALTFRAAVSRLTRPMECRDIKVRNCRLSSACTAIRFGVGDGMICDIDIKGLTIDNTRTAFEFCSSWSEKSPGTSFRDITIEKVELEAVRFLILRRLHGRKDRVFDNLVFRSIHGKSEMDPTSYGDPNELSTFGKLVFEDIDLGDSKISNAEYKSPYYVKRHRQFWGLETWDGSQLRMFQNPCRVRDIEAMLDDNPGLSEEHISNREYWDNVRNAKFLVRKAKKAMTEPMPTAKYEDYIYWITNKYMRLSHAAKNAKGKVYGGGKRFVLLMDLVRGECVENQGRFLPKIVEYLEAICEQPGWCMAPHDAERKDIDGIQPVIELGSAARASNLATTLDRLRGKLPEETVEHVMTQLWKRSFKPYLDNARRTEGKPDYWWWRKSNNWNAVCHGNVVKAALRVVEDKRLRAEFLESLERASDYFMVCFLEDGSCTEGLGYWHLGFGNHLSNIIAARSFTHGGVDLARDPVNRLAMEWPKKYTLDGKHGIGFGDSGRAIPEEELKNGVEVWPDYLPAFPDPLPIRDFLPDFEVLISRPALDERTAGNRGLYVAMKGAPNSWSHNHNDCGSYIIMVDGEEMTGDPGYLDYTKSSFGKDRYTSPFYGSYGHPVPYLGGNQKFNADDKVLHKLVSKSFTDEVDEITFDLSTVYPGLKAGSALRTFRYDRLANTFSVIDQVKLAKAEKLEFPIISYAEVTNEGNRFSLVSKKNPARRLTAEVKVSAKWHLKTEIMDKPPHPPEEAPSRYAIVLDKPTSRATVEVTFKIAD